MNTKINLVAFYTILRKEILRVLRIWVQTIVPPAITMTLYFVIFGNLIGSRIGNMEGYTYMQFIAPGIIMMSVITNSYGNVVSSFFGAKYGGYLDEMLVAPVANATIILGHIAGGIIRGLLVGSMVTIIALSFTDLKLTYPLVTFSIVFLSYHTRTDWRHTALHQQAIQPEFQLAAGRNFPTVLICSSKC